MDESAWQDGIIGINQDGKGRGLIRFLLSTLVSESSTVPDEPLASEQLRATRIAAHDALEPLGWNINPDSEQIFPVLRASLIAAGFDTTSAADAYKSEWKRKIDADIWPGMPARDRKKAVKAVIHNKLVQRLGMLWKSIGTLVADHGPEASGWVGIGGFKSTDGVAPAIYLKGRREVHHGWQVPTLLMDATMQMDLVRHLWPSMELKADIRITTPHQHVTQVFDRSYSKAQLAKENGLRDVHAILAREARKYAPQPVLAVVQKRVEEIIKPDPDEPGDVENPKKVLGLLPANLEVEHHNNIAGRDRWGPGEHRAGVAAIIIVGRTAPSPASVEDVREALTGAAIPRLTSWYPKADGYREIADGTFHLVETDRHPDAIAEQIRWSIVEGELVQIAGRSRAVNRKATNPVDLLVMTNAPVPIPVDHVISAALLEPNPHDLMMAAGGVAFSNPTSASDAYKHLWGTRKAAKHALASAEGRDRYSNLTEVTYQPEGAGHSVETAWVDLKTVLDPKAWLIERLGPLASFSFAGNIKVTADEVGKAKIEQALAAMEGGVLPLALDWLAENVFESRRTAARELANYKVPNPSRLAPNRNRKSLITEWGQPTPVLALYKLSGQRRASKALIRHDVADPQAELSRLLGTEVVEFKMMAEPNAVPVQAPEPLPIIWTPPPRTVTVDFVFALDIAPGCHPGGP